MKTCKRCGGNEIRFVSNGNDAALQYWYCDACKDVADEDSPACVGTTTVSTSQVIPPNPNRSPWIPGGPLSLKYNGSNRIPAKLRLVTNNDSIQITVEAGDTLEVRGTVFTFPQAGRYGIALGNLVLTALSGVDVGRLSSHTGTAQSLPRGYVEKIKKQMEDTVTRQMRGAFYPGWPDHRLLDDYVAIDADFSLKACAVREVKPVTGTIKELFQVYGPGMKVRHIRYADGSRAPTPNSTYEAVRLLKKCAAYGDRLLMIKSNATSEWSLEFGYNRTSIFELVSGPADEKEDT